MLRNQTSVPLIMPGPLLLALLGVALCVWSATGNALNLCFTSGCSLYQDFSVGGISMWWVGAGAFALLALLAMSGRPWLGTFCAGLCLWGDIFLLALMLTTAPCVACLIAALIFALLYVAFRYSSHNRDAPLSRSWLVFIWACLFIANVGAVVKAEADTWAMLGPEDAAVRLYFSPSCSACREAVNNLSGRVNVAYYPVAENDQDYPAIATMLAAVRKGDSMAEALNQAKAGENAVWNEYTPESLLLRFRVLLNKAHVQASGSEVVPYLEFHGLPAFLSQGSKRPQGRPTSGSQAPGTVPAQEAPGGAGEASGLGAGNDATLPIDMGIAGACGGNTGKPCP